MKPSNSKDYTSRIQLLSNQLCIFEQIIFPLSPQFRVMFISCLLYGHKASPSRSQCRNENVIQDTRGTKALHQWRQDHCFASESKQWHNTILKDGAQRANRKTTFQVINATSTQPYTDDLQLILWERTILSLPKERQTKPQQPQTWNTYNYPELCKGWYKKFTNEEDRKLNNSGAAVTLTEPGKSWGWRGPLEIM